MSSVRVCFKCKECFSDSFLILSLRISLHCYAIFNDADATSLLLCFLIACFPFLLMLLTSENEVVAALGLLLSFITFAGSVGIAK
jgi:hypothetical protein